MHADADCPFEASESQLVCFNEATQLACTTLDRLSVDQVTELLSNFILHAAVLDIPRTTTNFPRRPNPLWNEE